MKRLNIYFSDDEKAAIKQASQELEQSESDIVREAVRQWLKAHAKD